jgi:DNA repair protein RadC
MPPYNDDKLNPENPHLSIKDWAEDDRPREKGIQLGAKALSTAELLAILIGSGSRGESAVQLSQRILSDCGNDLHNLSKKTLESLKKYRGMGDAKAITIIAALEIAQRRIDTPVRERPVIRTSKDSYDCLAQYVAYLPYEEFWVLLLDRANKVMARRRISEGGVAGTLVDAKRVFQPAIEILASGIVLCHNHPSGNLQPSQADISLTAKLKIAATALDISLLDHLIIAETGYLSFADEGLL